MAPPPRTAAASSSRAGPADSAGSPPSAAPSCRPARSRAFRSRSAFSFSTRAWRGGTASRSTSLSVPA
ncbi:hypothetical protein GCM10009605_41400 [Nocardiopsis composta]